MEKGREVHHLEEGYIQEGYEELRESGVKGKMS